MGLYITSLSVSIGIAFFVLVPWMIPQIKRLAKPLMILGTLALLWVCFFDILPEMIEETGWLSTLPMLAVFGLVSWVHLKSHQHEHSKEAEEHDSEVPNMLVLSMSLHCLSNGMLLVASYEISQHFAESVFFSILAHKGFEALSLSSILLAKVKERKRIIPLAVIYGLSFPAGVLVTHGLNVFAGGSLSQETIAMVAAVITSIALGSLFGCLLFHFIVPLIQEAKQAFLPQPARERVE